MNTKIAFVSASLIATLLTTACTSMDPPQTEFLAKGAANRQAPRAATLDSLVIEDVQWLAGNSAEISPEERDSLRTRLADDLTRALSRGGRADRSPLRVRAAITRVVTISPALNVIGTLLTVGPLDRGGAAIEIEALDARTGESRAVMKKGYYPPIWEIAARFSKLQSAEIAIDELSAEFAAGLFPQEGPDREKAR